MKLNQIFLEPEKSLSKLKNIHTSFNYLKITIASPKRIRNWSRRLLPNGFFTGEVLESWLVNNITHIPKKDGLFCQKIFGPINNWKCECGKYNGFILNKICEYCNVEITEARVRRYRMGYIELNCPITHSWYLKGVPSYLLIFLKSISEKLSKSDIEEIVYFKEEQREEDKYKNPLNVFYTEIESENNELDLFFIESSTYSLKRKLRGSEVIQAALNSINISTELDEFRSSIGSIFESNTIRKIRILESFLATHTNPSWMILTVLPVLPPNLRPIFKLEECVVAADVNETYVLIIDRNKMLYNFLYIYKGPYMIISKSITMLQEGIDGLIDNKCNLSSRRKSLNNKSLKSFTEILRGKEGRFRQSLLGKRVDYSGRSVIIVGPTLKLNQCGLPYEMILKLFQPFLISELLQTKRKVPNNNIKLIQIFIKKRKLFIWTLLKKLVNKHLILLNRAPTLHRFGVQGFAPIIVLGQAIHLHPLVCTGFNADFDGDQMAVHLPLYESSQLEVYTMMRPSHNILSPSNGDVILKPTQDMVIGCYYLTIMITNNYYAVKKWFANEKEALSAFYQKKVTIHTPLLVRYSQKDFEVKIEHGKMKFFDINTKLSINEREITLLNIVGTEEKKFYLITNIGIFISHYYNQNIHHITDFFLETTPGRLIFSINLKNLLQK